MGPNKFKKVKWASLMTNATDFPFPKKARHPIFSNQIILQNRQPKPRQNPPTQRPRHFSKESKPLQYSIVGIGETTFHYFSNTLLQFLF